MCADTHAEDFERQTCSDNTNNRAWTLKCKLQGILINCVKWVSLQQSDRNGVMAGFMGRYAG